VRALICLDLDGPLIDVSTRYYAIYCDLVRSYDGLPLALEDYWRQKRNRIPDVDQFIAAGLGRDQANVCAAERVCLIEDSRYVRLDRIWEGTEGFLRQLHSAYDIAIVSFRGDAEQAESQLRAAGIRDLCNHVVCARATGEIRRPEAKAEMVRRIIGDDVPAGWFIGDTETDIRAGRLLGLRTAAASFGLRDLSYLEAERPDIVLRKPQEMHAWAAQL